MTIPNRGGRGPPCPLGKNAYDEHHASVEFYKIHYELDKNTFT